MRSQKQIMFLITSANDFYFVVKVTAIVLIVSLCFIAPSFASANPEELLAKEAPPLAKLLKTYSSHRLVLENYAKNQGFTLPFEHLATVVHELIHVDSAAHKAFWINDQDYLKPYVTEPQLWPSMTNADILPYLSSGPIANQYARNTPKNTLANCIDEINAYTHVMGFVSTHEPASASKQIAALEGHMDMVNVYLYELRKQNKQLTPAALETVNRVLNYGKRALVFAEGATK